MFRKAAVVWIMASGLLLASPSNGKEKGMTVAVKRVTPVLFVEKVRPCLEFWERLGFQRAMEVPDGDELAFAAVQKDGVEIMYQSFASAMKDPSASAVARQRLDSHAFLYVEVSDLDAIVAGLKGVSLEVEKHTTFYGATEVMVRDPGGHFITFAQFGNSGSSS
jgi:uncharacterized glyoxalase superfamily protein PhnB